MLLSGPPLATTFADTRKDTKVAVTQRVWTTREHCTQGRSRYGAPRPRRRPEVPDDLMDYDADPVATAGTVVTIRYDDSGETETFVLGRRFGKHTDLPVYSTLSPVGRAVLGARPGERRIAMIPHDTRPMPVTLLSAEPFEDRAGRASG